ncbi:unnamed protein product [Heterobilharzia americana]|nr:unnamed protein product [Heterobilharzia americana]
MASCPCSGPEKVISIHFCCGTEYPDTMLSFRIKGSKRVTKGQLDTLHVILTELTENMKGQICMKELIEASQNYMKSLSIPTTVFKTPRREHDLNVGNDDKYVQNQQVSRQKAVKAEIQMNPALHLLARKQNPLAGKYFFPVQEGVYGYHQLDLEHIASTCDH